MSTQQICEYLFDNSSPRLNKDGCFILDDQEWFVQQNAMVAFFKFGENVMWEDILNDEPCWQYKYRTQTLFEACQIASEPYLDELLSDAMPEYMRSAWADGMVDEQIRDAKNASIEGKLPEVHY